MRISDIDTIRGDRQHQKPFVAFKAEPEPPVLVDPAEPYGKDEPREAVALVELTSAEKALIIDILDQRRRSLLTNLRHQQMKPTTRGRTERRAEECAALIAKLKR